MSTVCIIDDDEAVRDSLCALLEANAFEVQAYESGEELLKTNRAGDCDCFVVDFHMPGMNGLELIEALRARGLSQNALIVSALRIQATPERMGRARVLATLTKPVGEAELLDWIQRALDGSRVTH